MNHTKQHDLLARYFSGEATTEERLEIDAWRQASAENQRAFAEFEKVWQSAAEKLPPLPNVDQAWRELSAKLGLPNEKRPARILEMKKTPQSVRRKFFWSDRYVRAAAAVLLLGFTAILYWFLRNANTSQVITASYGRQEHIRLPDGSTVTLNSGSEIKFSKNFADAARYVTLAGEAYFEVAHDNRPFFVNTSNAQIRVVGTKFGIWARNEQTRVTVREGRVVLRVVQLPKETAVELAANQMSLCRNRNKPEAPKIVDANHLLGWLEGKIVFDQTSLTEVIAELQRVYNVSIELSNPALGQNTITGSFHNKPIESVLASICLTLNLQFSRQADKFVIFE